MSFDNCEKWRVEIEKNAKDDVVVMLVGCKADVKQNIAARGMQRKVSIVQLGNKARSAQWRKLKTMYGECSAKTGYNVESTFRTTAELVVDQRQKGRMEQVQPRRRKQRAMNLQRAAQPASQRNSWCCLD